MGLVFVWGVLGLMPVWHHPRIDHRSSLPQPMVIDGDLRVDGLVGGGGDSAFVEKLGGLGFVLAGGGRFGLQRWHLLVYQRHTNQTWSWYLAHFRAFRQLVSVFVHLFLRIVRRNENDCFDNTEFGRP